MILVTRLRGWVAGRLYAWLLEPHQRELVRRLNCAADAHRECKTASAQLHTKNERAIRTMTALCETASKASQVATVEAKKLHDAWDTDRRNREAFERFCRRIDRDEDARLADTLATLATFRPIDVRDLLLRLREQQASRLQK